jgi:hypothetical protein
VKETCVLVIIVGLPNARSTCCTVANTRMPNNATSGRGRDCAVSTVANAATPTVAKPIRQIVFIVASSIRYTSLRRTLRHSCNAAASLP